eukprot:GHRQ01006111.1.p1 GENE.GHRQ01006111.1~~GHRQ01006111.1.p1  ORF type:complete len:160 (+),score=40.05 GHRQ01006111.1:417-896(+)
MSSDSEEYDTTRSPGFDLYVHILQKGFQLGSVLGVGAVAPARAAYTSLWLKQPVDPSLLARTAGATTLGAFTLVAVAGAVRVSNIDQDGLEDRAYRLHYNQGQNRTDVFAQAGAAAGLAAGAALLRGAAHASALHYLGCSSVGAAGGILLHVLTWPKEE